MPNKLSKQIKKEYKGWGDDAHSASYFTLKELIDFYKENPTSQVRGMISPEAQNKLDNEGILPESWCQGTTIEGYEFRTWQEPSCLKYFIDSIKSRVANDFWIWDFQDDYEEKIYEVADKVRVVFWFDN